MVFISNNNSPEVLKPGKQAFDFPSTPITSELSAVLGRRLLASSSVRRNHLNATLMHKLLIKTVTVIGFIGGGPQRLDHLSGELSYSQKLDKL